MSPLPHPIEAPAPMTAGRIGLRLIHRRDAAVLERLLKENRAWLEPWEATYPGGGGTVPGSVSMRPTIQILRRQLRTGVGITFVVTFDGLVVGQLSVSEISGGAMRSAQIGYWVSRHVAGQGITPVAVALAIDYLFHLLRLHRVEICIRPENAASLRVVAKLGLRYEGERQRYIHIAGDWRDHSCFAVTREEVPLGMLMRLGAATP
ncbi:MAG: GNAT family N-acetyltransferase [Actinobacteria bacterium]|nr:GNAT family N-acetyltransferase [Actinomycetota bacterium]